MLRSKIALAAAAALVAILNTAVRADDAGVSAAPPGAPIVNAAPDAAPPVTTHETTFGTEFRQPIGQNADDQAAADRPAATSGSTVSPKPPRPAVAARHDDDDPGPAIANAAQKTGRAIDNGTKDFRDGAEKFFKDVGHFFSGDK
jgi:hypothetical protein